jgi:hypothetical protein
MVVRLPAVLQVLLIQDQVEAPHGTELLLPVNQVEVVL